MLLRKAIPSELPRIWEILQQAIAARKADGSLQWQNGYPNEQTVISDIEKGYGYVLEENEIIIAYAAIIFDIEPVYNDIEGQWLTNGEYVVIHRVATALEVKGKGIATRLFQMIEELAVRNAIYSVKVDTNFDNIPMLKIMERLEYKYCGEVFFHGSARMAFEKVLELPE